MVLPLWGQLEKAQDDPQTIADAIAAAIVAHEQDPTAHLGEGESLQAHKSDEIIDHPAQSVVMDKIPFTQYDEYRADLGSHDFSFEEGSGGASADTFSYSMFSQTYVLAIGYTNHPAGDDYPEADLMYQFKLSLNGHQSSNGSLVFSWCSDTATDSTRMSIEKSGTSFYWRLYKGGVVVKEFNLAVGAFWSKYLRIWFDSQNDTIRLYIGTTEVATYEDEDWRDFVFAYFATEASRSTNTNISLSITDWKMISNLNID